MFETHNPDPLLAQVPLTVSPFLSIPSAVTLPYTFKQIPTSLPTSLIGGTQSGEKPKYIKSASGHAAHPEDIINSCKSLQDHILKNSAEAEKLIKQWEQGIKERELAEKRRVAPGWLDREEKLLEPTKAEKEPQNILERENSSEMIPSSMPPAIQPRNEGEEIDRAFGGLSMK